MKLEPIQQRSALRAVRIERNRPIAPQIYAALRQRIVDNRLRPGEALSESALAADLAVSRTPLRAALQQLATEGLIEIRPQVGSVVAPLDQDRLEETVLIRSALEEAVVRRLAGAKTGTGVLEDQLATQERLARRDDYAAFFRADEVFHRTLAELAGMPNAWRLVHGVKGHVDRQRYRLMAGIPMRSLRAWQDHRTVVDRIAAHDPDGAARVMRAHVTSVLELQGGSDAPARTGPSEAG